MSVESTLRRGREVRRKLMRDRCRIIRPTDREFDPVTGDYTDDGEALRYEGICHFKSWSSLGQRIGNVTGRETVLMLYEFLIPFEAQGLEIGESDIIYVTHSTDSWAIGEPFPIVSVENNHDRTCRHITVNHLGRGDVQYG